MTLCQTQSLAQCFTLHLNLRALHSRSLVGIGGVDRGLGRPESVARQGH